MTRRRLPFRGVARALLATWVGAAGAPASAAAGVRPVELEVYAAASLSGAFEEIGRRLEALRPGVRVRMNFAGSQQLASQIEQGAPADVFAAADERWMDHVGRRGLLAERPRVFAGNRLVLIVPARNPARIERVRDVARSGVKLVLGADAVPAGRYARLLLRNLSRDPAFGAGFAARALANVVSEEENVRAVVGKVRLGEADAGIVYRSDVTAAVLPHLRVFEVPGRAGPPAPYPIAVLRRSMQPVAAREFVALVLSPEGQRILSRHGFEPRTEASP